MSEEPPVSARLADLISDCKMISALISFSTYVENIQEEEVGGYKFVRYSVPTAVSTRPMVTEMCEKVCCCYMFFNFICCR
jgi:hypothetical protein